jgi:transposase-like protein
MSCSRRGCSNVMCDTYINDIGYVCHDCQKEFQLFLDENNKNPKNANEIHDELEKFMETTSRKNYDSGELSIDEFFRQNTRS